MNDVLRLGWATVAISVLVLALKAAAWLATGSLALYADALESTVNVAAALGAVVALRLSSRPADANHPYGHHKAEYLSAVVEGTLVLVTALVIGREALAGFQVPRQPLLPLEGLALSTAAALVNLAWALVLLSRGRRLRSPALTAGGRHIMMDVWTTGAVLAGFAAVPITGWAWLDPGLAALVAANILWAGWRLVRQSIGGLMDEVTDPAAVAAIERTIAATATGALEAHDVRTRFVGRVTFIDFHLVVNGTMSVTDAHAICDRIERALLELQEGASITIHVEPQHEGRRGGALRLRTHPGQPGPG